VVEPLGVEPRSGRVSLRDFPPIYTRQPLVLLTFYIYYITIFWACQEKLSGNNWQPSVIST